MISHGRLSSHQYLIIRKNIENSFKKENSVENQILDSGIDNAWRMY